MSRSLHKLLQISLVTEVQCNIHQHYPLLNLTDLLCNHHGLNGPPEYQRVVWWTHPLILRSQSPVTSIYFIWVDLHISYQTSLIICSVQVTIATKIVLKLKVDVHMFHTDGRWALIILSSSRYKEPQPCTGCNEQKNNNFKIKQSHCLYG